MSEESDERETKPFKFVTGMHKIVATEPAQLLMYMANKVLQLVCAHPEHSSMFTPCGIPASIAPAQPCQVRILTYSRRIRCSLPEHEPVRLPQTYP
jgi:hypothetical protein